MRLKSALLISASLFAMSGAVHAADDACVGKVPAINVIAQGMPSVTELDKYLGEFNAKWKTAVKINLLGENERRAKARLDASTGAGAYQVYYVDEANTPEYATAGWVYPLKDVLPTQVDLPPGWSLLDPDRQGYGALAPVQISGEEMVALASDGRAVMLIRADFTGRGMVSYQPLTPGVERLVWAR